MANSQRYRFLISRIKFLENNVLPADKPSGNYTKREVDLIKSYVLLVHAEIEAFFEDRAKAKVRKALADWIASRTKSTCLKAVLAFTGNELSYEKRRKEESKSIVYRVNRAVSHYLSSINSNNGVKENDLINMLIPLGIELDELDVTWLSIMDSFGAIRGNIAHNSVGAQSVLDRNSEVQRIQQQILPGIATIDEMIQRLH